MTWKWVSHFLTKWYNCCTIQSYLSSPMNIHAKCNISNRRNCCWDTQMCIVVIHFQMGKSVKCTNPWSTKSTKESKNSLILRGFQIAFHRICFRILSWKFIQNWKSRQANTCSENWKSWAGKAKEYAVVKQKLRILVVSESCLEWDA